MTYSATKSYKQEYNDVISKFNLIKKKKSVLKVRISAFSHFFLQSPDSYILQSTAGSCTAELENTTLAS